MLLKLFCSENWRHTHTNQKIEGNKEMKLASSIGQTKENKSFLFKLQFTSISGMKEKTTNEAAAMGLYVH